MRKILLIAVLFTLSTLTAFCQKDDVSFLIQTIKQNYSGYSDKVKGSDFDNFALKVIKENGADTFRILSKLADFFGDQHLKIYGYRNIKKSDSALYSRNLKTVTAYLSNKMPKDKYEGYWVNDYNDCLIAIKKVKLSPWKYQAYVVESHNNALPEGLICAQFEYIKDSKFLTDYITSVSGSRVYLESEFRSDSIFTLGAYGKWRKLKHYENRILQTLPLFNETASARVIDAENYLITMPGNSEENTKIVDSIVKADYQKIASSKNLILDIRNNLGGTVRTYAPLVPFVCTNPIQRISVTTLYSDALVKSEESEIEYYKKKYPSNVEAIKKKDLYLAEIKGKVGKLIYNKGSIFSCDSVKKYPENVAIICNYACFSAAEMMILDFKQSKKVKVFGEHTLGAVDYLDNFAVELPSQKYTLDIASSKREIPKGQSKIDGKGIMPDISIAESVEDWVSYVVRYYKNNKK